MQVTWSICVACLGLVYASGCRGTTGGEQQKAPRPVTTFRLQSSDPGRQELVAGLVESWKTEEIGFEVSGRVEFVEEADREVEGSTRDPEGKTLNPGDRLASLEAQRYQLAVNSAEAQIRTAAATKAAAEVELDKVLPARLKAAEAEARVSKTEMDRRRQLLARQAVSQEEYERSVADWDRAKANVESLQADKEAKAAEIASHEAKIDELKEVKAKAKWDVEQCELRSPFAGQVAEVHVIPGAYVDSGQPVVTVQMMHPISIEVEVSAATTRRLNYMDVVPVYVAQPDGSKRPTSALVYTIDPTADAETRTFTVTLLARNEKLTTPIPPALQDEPFARAFMLRPVMMQPLDGVGTHVVDERLLQQDDQGDYVWKVTNRSVKTFMSETDAMLTVRKIRVTLGDRRVSFLGLWDLREVTINEGEPLTPRHDMVAGAIIYPPGTDDHTWNGASMLLDRERWLLRPGDLVGVDLQGGAIDPGFYVPSSAILTTGDKSYVFRVEPSEDGSVARRIEVQVGQAVNTRRRIEAVGQGPLAEGMQLVLDGALFLVDGETIHVAGPAEVLR